MGRHFRCPVDAFIKSDKEYNNILLNNVHSELCLKLALIMLEEVEFPKFIIRLLIKTLLN